MATLDPIRRAIGLLLRWERRKSRKSPLSALSAVPLFLQKQIYSDTKRATMAQSRLLAIGVSIGRIIAQI